jgi:hypothetical protein
MVQTFNPSPEKLVYRAFLWVGGWVIPLSSHRSQGRG